MDVRLIRPFVEAVDSVFQTMLNVRPVRCAERVGPGAANEEDWLTSVIGISGEMHGVIVLRFPRRTACVLTARMLGLDAVCDGPEVVDAVSELVNMVAGSAKARLATDPPLNLSLPTVVEGTDYRVKYPSQSSWLEVPFASDAGRFIMEVTFASLRGNS